MSEKTIVCDSMSGGAALLQPGKTLDNDNAHEMVEAITNAQAGGHKFIIIDMRDLEFISSSGVGSILGSVEVARESGGDVILCNVSESIQNILNVLDLMDYLTVADDREAAQERCGLKKVL
ncbi:MAG: STAS domain-containing protein [Candidatus Zixiibacteriota bacterium]|nr:MAG: STAS domain-containing protein [candidate division Zixibacteria bacterium]